MPGARKRHDFLIATTAYYAPLGCPVQCRFTNLNDIRRTCGTARATRCAGGTPRRSALRSRSHALAATAAVRAAATAAYAPCWLAKRGSMSPPSPLPFSKSVRSQTM